MASGINKKLLAKQDMNFFREFTANAARAARMLGYAMFLGILVVVIVLGLIGFLAVRNFMKQQEIDTITAELQSPEYAGLEEKAKQLQEELRQKNNYYYALTSMRTNVDRTATVPIRASVVNQRLSSGETGFMRACSSGDRFCQRWRKIYFITVNKYSVRTLEF